MYNGPFSAWIQNFALLNAMPDRHPASLCSHDIKACKAMNFRESSSMPSFVVHYSFMSCFMSIMATSQHLYLCDFQYLKPWFWFTHEQRYSHLDSLISLLGRIFSTSECVCGSLGGWKWDYIVCIVFIFTKLSSLDAAICCFAARRRPLSNCCCLNSSPTSLQLLNHGWSSFIWSQLFTTGSWPIARFSS